MPRLTKKMEERRSAVRISCQAPLMYKICKEETISKIMEGYTRNVSANGLQCTVPEEVPVGCTLWLRLDKDTLVLCEEIDKRAVILQQGILGKVMWTNLNPNNTYDVGLQFLVREEKRRRRKKQ